MHIARPRLDASILFIIAADPRRTHRAGEALRIALALGLGSEHQDVRVLLLDDAPRLLQPDAEDLQDAEHLGRYLPLFRDWHTPFYLQTGAAKRFDLGDSGYRTEEIPPAEVHRMMIEAEHTIVMP